MTLEKPTCGPGQVQRLVRPLGRSPCATTTRQLFEPRTAKPQLFARSIACRGVATLRLAAQAHSQAERHSSPARPGSQPAYQTRRELRETNNVAGSGAAPGSASGAFPVRDHDTPTLRATHGGVTTLRPFSAPRGVATLLLAARGRLHGRTTQLTCPAALAISLYDAQGATGIKPRGRVRCSAWFGLGRR